MSVEPGCLDCFCEVLGRALLVMFAFAIMVSAAFTQPQTGTLVGLIHDPQGKVIAGVEVKLSPADASQPITHTITDAAGRFQCVRLLPRVYSLELSRSGSQDEHFSNLHIDAGRTLDISVVLHSDRPSGTKQVSYMRVLGRDVLVQSLFDQVSMHTLPTTRRIWSLVENQATSTVTGKLDTGGLETGTRELFGARGLSWTENQYSLNGFDVTDPYLPGLPLTDPDFDALGEVAVITSAKPTVFSGSGVNLILTTSAAAQGIHGAARGFFSNHALQSDNMDARLVRLGFPGPERLRHLLDASGQLSGGLLLGENKLPFFISLSTQSLSKALGGFPAPIDADVHHWLTEFTPFQRAGKQLDLLYAGQHVFNSAEGADPRVAPSATLRGKDKFHQFQARWSSSLGAASSYELGFGVAHANILSGAQPGKLTPSTIDLPQLTVTGAAPFSLVGTRTRHQAYAQFQTIHNGSFGSHSLVLGGSIDRSNIANRWDALGGIERILVEGGGAEVVRWNSPTQAHQHVTDFSVFAQDAWRPNRWLAVPFGLRLENSSGESSVASNRISWTTIEPRVGFVTRLPVSGVTLRGGFARYGQLLQGRYFDFGNATTLGGQVFRWQDANDDRQVQTTEIGQLLRVFGGPYSGIDKNPRRPVTDEITAEVTKEVGDHFVIQVRFFRRDDRHLVAIVNSGVPFSSYDPTIEVDPGDDGIPGTFDDRLLTLFNRKPLALGQDFFVLSNPPGYCGSDKGLEVEIFKLFARHWEGALNFTAMHASYPTNPGNAVFQNDPGFIITDQSVFAASNADPNTLLFANGRTYFDRGFTGKLSAYYEAPYGVRVGMVARYYDGLVFGRLLFVNGFEQGPFFARVTARGDQGAYRTNFNSTLDLRVARAFTLKRTKLSLDLDVFNLLNLNRDTLENDLTGPEFTKRIPLAIQAPRSFRLGLEWEF